MATTQADGEGLSRLAALAATLLQTQTDETRPPQPKPRKITDISKDAFAGVLAVLSADTEILPERPSLTSGDICNNQSSGGTMKPGDAKRLEAVKETFGQLTVVDKQMIYQMQLDCERATRCALQYRQKMVEAERALEMYKGDVEGTDLREGIRDKLVGMYIHGQTGEQTKPPCRVEKIPRHAYMRLSNSLLQSSRGVEGGGVYGTVQVRPWRNEERAYQDEARGNKASGEA